MFQNVGTLELLLIGAFLLGGVGAVGVIVWAMKRESKLNAAKPGSTTPTRTDKAEKRIEQQTVRKG